MSVCFLQLLKLLNTKCHYFLNYRLNIEDIVILLHGFKPLYRRARFLVPKLMSVCFLQLLKQQKTKCIYFLKQRINPIKPYYEDNDEELINIPTVHQHTKQNLYYPLYIQYIYLNISQSVHNVSPTHQFCYSVHLSPHEKKYFCLSINLVNSPNCERNEQFWQVKQMSLEYWERSTQKFYYINKY